MVTNELIQKKFPQVVRIFEVLKEHNGMLNWMIDDLLNTPMNPHVESALASVNDARNKEELAYGFSYLTHIVMCQSYGLSPQPQSEVQIKKLAEPYYQIIELSELSDVLNSKQIV